MTQDFGQDEIGFWIESISVPGCREELPVGLPHICTTATTWRYWWWTRRTDCGECRSGCTSNSAWEWWMRRIRSQPSEGIIHTKPMKTQETTKNIIRGTLVRPQYTCNTVAWRVEVTRYRYQLTGKRPEWQGTWREQLAKRNSPRCTR